ncbi:MAG: DUF4861 family protein [Tidjanibacter sp.]|nr:DUF4861 family protein [Tidjanibacter sp.]
MKKYSYLMVAALLLLASCSQQRDEIIVINHSDIDRVGEMVEVEASRFDVPEGKRLAIYNNEGQEVASQLTYDGKIIFQTDVKAGEQAFYTVTTTNKSAKMQSYACGRVYPERVDDVAWESDLIAYRAYGPALQQSGERAFGYDVWVKNNTELPVVEERYAKELNPQTKARIAELRQSDPAAADALAASVSYHNDHGNGFDAYKVGPTLGGGATALLEKGKIIYPYCYKECEILDNGPLRFTARLTYHPTMVGGSEVEEVRTISLDKGSFLNKTTVEYVGAEGVELDVMMGVVLHEKDVRSKFDNENYYLTYAEMVEAPDGGELYQALYSPEGWSGAENRLWTKKDDKPAGTFGHAAIYQSTTTNKALTYYWGALWSKATLVDVSSKEAFDGVMAEVVAAKQMPLEVTTIVYEK